MTPNSFEVLKILNKTKLIRLHWETFRREDIHGDNLSFIIEGKVKFSTLIHFKLVNILGNNDQKETQNHYIDVYTPTDDNASYKIFSKNEMGASADFARIFIPSENIRNSNYQKIKALILDSETGKGRHLTFKLYILLSLSLNFF